MAKELQDDPEELIVANFARWAGDISYAMQRLREIVPPDRRLIETRSVDYQLTSTDDLVEKRLAEKRQRQSVSELLEAVSEEQYRRLALIAASREGKGLRAFEQQTDRLEDSSPPPTNIIEGSNIRGVVEPISEHEYELRAFLTNLKWEDDFFRRVEDQIRLYRGSHPDGGDSQPRGGTWILEGDLFRIVSVDDFGLIECRGTWTKRDPPDAVEVFRLFKAVLKPLDR